MWNYWETAAHSLIMECVVGGWRTSICNWTIFVILLSTNSWQVFFSIPCAFARTCLWTVMVDIMVAFVSKLWPMTCKYMHTHCTQIENHRCLLFDTSAPGWPCTGYIHIFTTTMTYEHWHILYYALHGDSDALTCLFASCLINLACGRVCGSWFVQHLISHTLVSVAIEFADYTHMLCSVHSVVVFVYSHYLLTILVG